MHNEELHNELLQKLCRICGAIQSARKSKVYPVLKFNAELDAAFNIKSTSDILGVHPVNFCQKCCYVMKNCAKRKTTSSVKVYWSGHDLDSVACGTCSLGKKKVVGGRATTVIHAGGRPKDIKTIEDVMNLDPAKPIPGSVEKLLSHLVQRKMNESTMLNQSVQFNTGGSQPLTLTPVSIPRVETHNASKRTVKNRTRQLNSIIRLSAGDNIESYAAQTSHIVKTADEETRHGIIDNLKLKTTIPAEHVAAMKATQNIPWNLLDEIRRWLTTFNVQLSTKNKVRDVANEWSGEGIISEHAPLFVTKKKKTEVKPIAWSYINNIVCHILTRLGTLKECKLLVNHSFIAEDEIHVKIGGDHGGGSFKMSYQIANVNNPNKLDNTVIFSIFEAKDCRANLRICLERFKAHIDVLLKQKWEGKTFRVFMFGDYAFLCAMFGISGAAGKHPCLWCEITSEKMQLPQSDRADDMPNARTLQNLKTHYGEFTTKYGSKLSNAKLIFNVMDDIFFNIPLEQTCLPGLHINLGVVLKIFTDVIEQYCATLDNLMNSEDNFHQINVLRSELVEMEERRDLICSEIEWYSVKYPNSDHISDYEQFLDMVTKEITEKELAIGQLQSTREEDDVGPCVKSLDETLKQIGVERQAYHSNSITGNHCHVILKGKNIEIICKSVPAIVAREVGETEIYRNSLVKFQEIQNLMCAYSKCHNTFDVARYLSLDEIQQFREDVKYFMAYLRKNFAHVKITPKMHMLEDHMYEFLLNWRTGCGFYGEQGGESAHNGINKMKHRYSNIKNDLDRLNYIMKQHLLSTNPKAQVLRPKKMSRNLKRKST